MKPDTKLAKKAIVYLRREALVDIRRGQLYYRQHTIGKILTECGFPGSYWERDRIYQGFVASLNHACELGILESSCHAPLKQYRYKGPDLAAVVKEQEAATKREDQKLRRILRRYGLRSAKIRRHLHEGMVEIPIKTLYRILKVK